MSSRLLYKIHSVKAFVLKNQEETKVFLLVIEVNGMVSTHLING